MMDPESSFSSEAHPQSLGFTVVEQIAQPAMLCPRLMANTPVGDRYSRCLSSIGFGL